MTRAKWTRRTFIKAGAAFLGSAAIGSLRTDDSKAGDEDEFGGFTVGIQSYTFRKFNLEQALKRTQELGLKYIEFATGHVKTDISSEQITAVKKLCSEYGITPVAYGVQKFTKDDDANKKLFEFGKALGIRTFSADPEPDSFDSLDKICEEYKISIAIHPHGPQGNKLHRWYGSDVILPAVKDHHPLIGTCLDTGHLIRAAQLDKELQPVAEILAMGPRNFGIHLKDHDNAKRRDVPFGQGALDVPGVLKALRQVKFGGYISIEYEANADNPSPDVKECLGVFKDSLKKLS